MRHNSPAPGPSELERARMRRVLNGLPDPKKGTETFSETIYSELRAMRSELSTLSDRIAGGSASEEVLSRGEVAKLLGVCLESVTKLVRNSKLPCRRVGKEYRFLESEVLSWLASRSPETEE